MDAILVTGGAGFIGGALVQHRGVRVTNLDALAYAGNLESLAVLRDNPRHVFSPGDIRDGARVARLLREHQPDAIVPGAVETQVDRSIDGPRAFVETNVQYPASATGFAYPAKDPERYGVMELDDQGRPRSIVEKPRQPRSNLAVTGLDFHDNRVPDIAANLKPSARGELEITDVNPTCLEEDTLQVQSFSRGFVWLDTGTPESLIQPANFVETLETRQGLKIACIEEVAWRMGLIGTDQLMRLASALKNAYGDYLRSLPSMGSMPV